MQFTEQQEGTMIVSTELRSEATEEALYEISMTLKEAVFIGKLILLAVIAIVAFALGYMIAG